MYKQKICQEKYLAILAKFYKLQVTVSMLNEDTNSVVTSELELEGGLFAFLHKE